MFEHHTRRSVFLSALLAVGLCFTVVSASTASEDEATGLEIGDALPAADTKMLGVDSEEITIADLEGDQGTLVIFSCNACPWAVAWEDRIAAIGNEYREKGIGVIMINANDPAKVAADGYEAMQVRAEEKNFEFPYVVDDTSNMARVFGATRTPEVFLFNADENLVYHGAVDDNAKEPDQVEAHYLRDAIEAMLAGEEIAVAETKAIGCSIKFRPTT